MKTVDNNTGAVLDASNSVPIKLLENWSWAKLVGANNWKLEGYS